MKKEIEIPEGYEAKIVGNKVVFVPKESEDGRIKNLIYCIVRDRREVGEMLKANGCPVKKVLSWIAKQEEQKPRSTEETELNSIAFLEQLGYTCVPPGAEQKPIFKEGDKVIWQGEEFNILDVNEDSYNVGGYILPFYRQKELSLVEQKPVEWTIDDAKPGDILNSTRVQATIIYKGKADDGKHILAYCALQKGIFISKEMLWDRDFELASEYWKNALYEAMVRKGYDWDADRLELKKKEGKPAEWSEEDKENIELIATHLDNLGNTAMAEILLNLRPQPHWKPSKEQMKALKWAASPANPLHAVLSTLYEDLEKL